MERYGVNAVRMDEAEPPSHSTYVVVDANNMPLLPPMASKAYAEEVARLLKRADAEGYERGKCDGYDLAMSED